MGALYYRAVYEVAGLQPFAFRVVTYVLFCLNAVLAFFLVQRLTASREIAFLTILIWCYHHRFFDLFNNNGTVYDVLCFTWYVGALLFYVQIRQSGRHLRWYEVIAFLFLFVAALNAKEMGITLPAVVIAYELIYRPRPVGGTWIRPATAVAVMAALAIAAGAAVTKPGKGSLFYGNAAYVQHLTVRQFFINQRHMLDDLTLHESGYIKTSYVAMAWALLIAGAFIARRKYVWFALAFLLITPLPVAFIQARGFFTMYLPYLGWAMYTAALIVLVRGWMWRRIWNRPPIPAGALEPERIATAALLALALLQWKSVDPYTLEFNKEPDREQIRRTIADLEHMRPCPAKGGRVLFLNDRWQEKGFGAVFATRLVCHNPDLEVDLAWNLAEAERDIDWSRYTYVLDYESGRLVRRNGSPC
jgi:hypothetical protein